jgi:hypothetical protein
MTNADANGSSAITSEYELFTTVEGKKQIIYNEGEA